MQLKVDLHLNWRNGLSLIAGVCVVLLAIIPLKVDPSRLGWLRWQVAIYVLSASAIASLFVQAMTQSKEDHKRDQKEIERDKRQESIESKIAGLSEQLKTGTPKPTITESAVKLEVPPPVLEPEPPPDIDGEVYRLVMSPRSMAWPIIRDVFKLQGRPDDAGVDTDILVDMYIVNQNLRNPEHLKDLRLSAEVNGKRINFECQDDLMAEPFGDHEYEYGLKTKDSQEIEPLKRLFDKLPIALQPRQPADGWVRFMARDINPEKIANDTIVLKVINSIGKEYVISKAATKQRKGEIHLRRLRA